MREHRAGHAACAVADKRDSQEICFVPDDDYAAVVERAARRAVAGGDIVDAEGRVLGRHGGVHRFTVGQRKGLGLSAPEPLYVLAVSTADRARVDGRAARGARAPRRSPRRV